MNVDRSMIQNNLDLAKTALEAQERYQGHLAVLNSGHVDKLSREELIGMLRSYVAELHTIYGGLADANIAAAKALGLTFDLLESRGSGEPTSPAGPDLSVIDGATGKHRKATRSRRSQQIGDGRQKPPRG